MTNTTPLPLRDAIAAAERALARLEDDPADDDAIDLWEKVFERPWEVDIPYPDADEGDAHVDVSGNEEEHE